jgi:hypothetical protein
LILTEGFNTVDSLGKVASALVSIQEQKSLLAVTHISGFSEIQISSAAQGLRTGRKPVTCLEGAESR